MRWESPKPGDVRVRVAFLFFPKTIQCETRWLEFAAWEEIRRKGGWWKNEPDFWDPRWWVDEVTGKRQ